jgi:hypothetical protein
VFLDDFGGVGGVRDWWGANQRGQALAGHAALGVEFAVLLQVVANGYKVTRLLLVGE